MIEAHFLLDQVVAQLDAVYHELAARRQATPLRPRHKRLDASRSVDTHNLSQCQATAIAGRTEAITTLSADGT